MSFQKASLALLLIVLIGTSCSDRSRKDDKQKPGSQGQQVALVSDIKAHIEKEEWIAAGNKIIALEKLNRDHPELEPFRQIVVPHWQQIKAKEKAEKRNSDLEAAISRAIEISNNKQDCQDTQAVAAAWKELKKSKAADPSRSAAEKAAQKLERCRVAAVRQFRKTAKKKFQDMRVNNARVMESTFLDDGFNVEASAVGSNKDVLVIRYSLANRVFVHQMLKAAELINAIETVGFRKLRFEDGYQFHWVVDLTPRNIVDEKLAKDGVDHKFELATD